MDKKEMKKLFSYAKHFLKKEMIRKIKKLEDDSDRAEVLKYSIKMNLDSRYNQIREEIRRIEDEGKEEAFYLLLKASMLRSKIKLFDATFHQSDFMSMMNKLKEVERGIKAA